MNFIRSLHLGRVYPSLSYRTEDYPEFFMFDYHDYLKKDDPENKQRDKQRDKQQNMDLASQDIRLVSIKDNDQETEEKFWKDAVSDRYIAIIMVSFAPGKQQASANGADEANVFAFLETCTQCVERLDKIQAVNHYIYQSMGYSDLCVAISTNNPNTPYEIATDIRNCTLNEEGAHGFPPSSAIPIRCLESGLIGRL